MALDHLTKITSQSGIKTTLDYAMSDLTVDTITVRSGGGGLGGNVNAGIVTISSLTVGTIPYVGTGQTITESDNLTWDNSKVHLRNLGITSTKSLKVTGISTFDGAVSVGGTFKIPTATGANSNENLRVLYQTSDLDIDSDTGLLYNPAEDTLKVNGALLSANSLYGAAGTIKLAAASYSSTSYVQVKDKVELHGNVGIGSTIPMFALEVVSNEASGYIASFRQHHPSNSAQLILHSPADNNVRPTSIDFANGGTVKWSIGQAYASASSQAFHIATSALQSNMHGSKVVVTTAGNVGIGSSVPTYKLEVDGGTQNTVIALRSTDAKAAISFLDNTSGGYGRATIGGEGDEVYITSGAGVEALRIDTNGKIGVGLAPNAWQSSTTSKVIQIGNSSVWDYNLQQFDLGQNFYYDGTNYKYIANGYATKLAQLKSSGDFVFYQSSIEGTGGNNLTWYEKLRLNWGTSGHNGTVDVKGIPAHLRLNSLRDTSDWDATDPIGKLDFYVGSDTSNNLPYAAGFIHCLNENDNVGEPSGALVFGSSTANASGGAVERLRITSTGKVQISPYPTHTYHSSQLSISANVSNLLELRTTDSTQSNTNYVKRFAQSFIRATSQTTLTILTLGSTSGNSHVSIEIKFYAVGATSNTSAIIVWTAWARQAGGGGSYTYVDGTCVSNTTVAGAIGNGTLAWSGAALQYTTDAPQNYTKYNTEITVWAHDRMEISFFS